MSSLNKKIKNELLKTKKGKFTKPILIPGGFLILKVEEERQTEIITDIEKELDILGFSMGGIIGRHWIQKFNGYKRP